MLTSELPCVIGTNMSGSKKHFSILALACRQYPKPIQKPPPIHFGGESDAALRRAVDLGQGWYGFNLELDQAAERLARLETLLDAKGRKRSDLMVSVSAPWRQPPTTTDLLRLRDLGVDQVIVIVLGFNRDHLLEGLDRGAALIDSASKL